MLLLDDRAVARGSTKPTCRQAARSVVPVAGVRDAVTSGRAVRRSPKAPAACSGLRETGGLRGPRRCVGRRWLRGWDSNPQPTDQQIVPPRTRTSADVRRRCVLPAQTPSVVRRRPPTYLDVLGRLWPNCGQARGTRTEPDAIEEREQAALFFGGLFGGLASGISRLCALQGPKPAATVAIRHKNSRGQAQSTVGTDQPSRLLPDTSPRVGTAGTPHP